MYLFALTVTLIVTSCGQKKGEDIPLVRPVKTATVSSQSVILKDFSGMVEAVEYVKLAFRVSGQIIDLPVVEGQRVRKGQLIAAIDPRDISLQYAADKAAYETAAAQVERNKRLLGRQAISLQEYEISVANYQKAKSAYELSTNNMRDTKLLAPFDGSIEKRLVENYQRVNSGEGIVRLVNTQKLRIKFTDPMITCTCFVPKTPHSRWSSIRTKAIYSMPDWKSILTYRPTARAFRLPSSSTTPPSTVPYTT